jgi:hypothetical protein
MAFSRSLGRLAVSAGLLLQAAQELAQATVFLR